MRDFTCNMKELQETTCKHQSTLLKRQCDKVSNKNWYKHCCTSKVDVNTYHTLKSCTEPLFSRHFATPKLASRLC